MRALLPLAAAATLLLATAGTPVSALDAAKPTACNGMAYTDPAGDNAATTVPTPATGTDLLGGFLKFDGAKGDEAATYNLVIKELDPEVPPGYVTVSWVAYYLVGDVVHFVRAISDFGGDVVFE